MRPISWTAERKEKRGKKKTMVKSLPFAFCPFTAPGTRYSSKDVK